ncbi:hypothetical protein PFICI_05400 [Pestalotiopsis fici W106-1]|uniref:Fe2OG dioxygenase domain-containing protein n=1 Tax=Pestalotiopsis fici (strain W106-1 / CGMCC3.15140) TaxID=1229662 RepID=W3XBX3_PESFW|nr:uncharacterized protein PFICI_05400 [Pestalotiopsis fici W106-1]ETS83524.1 hypothetical protein PFICI_05400 [Pestalotiopsis fici W106-1]
MDDVVLHDFGFVKVTGHGVSNGEIREALDWTQKLFRLSYDEKMKARNPPGPMPHRGYSGTGKEKVYSKEDVELLKNDSGDVGKGLRKISDYKESYEIGSEHDPVQENIWLPEEVLPGYRSYMSGWYERLAGVSKLLLQIIGLGLEIEPDTEAHRQLLNLISDRHCQLRLLHYPPISKDKLENEMLARLPAHHDWGTFTLLFQDERGGLELQDPKTKAYLSAEPEEGSLVLNVGDMLQRSTNDYFISALHRVTVPTLDKVPAPGLPPRYSIPFFTCPDFASTVATLPKFITEETPGKYEPVRFDEYGSIVSKYQYQGE